MFSALKHFRKIFIYLEVRTFLLYTSVVIFIKIIHPIRGNKYLSYILQFMSLHFSLSRSLSFACFFSSTYAKSTFFFIKNSLYRQMCEHEIQGNILRNQFYLGISFFNFFQLGIFELYFFLFFFFSTFRAIECAKKRRECNKNWIIIIEIENMFFPSLFFLSTPWSFYAPHTSSTQYVWKRVRNKYD